MNSLVQQRRRFPRGLYAITPELADTEALIARVAAALRGGATAIQYRNKTATTAGRLEQATALRAVCSAGNAVLIINDDIDIAAVVGADGVHLGRDDASIAVARARLPQALVGVSCYDQLDRATAAVAQGADYVAFGSFFPSLVKPDARRADVALISAAKAHSDVPVVAIGGITAANAPPLIAAGADALAVITSVFGAVDTQAAARAIASLFKL